MKQMMFFTMMLMASYVLNAQNAFFGTNAGNSTTSGRDNTFLGAYAGYANSTGKENTYIGIGAGFLNTDGSNNICIGTYAGYNIKGSNQLVIANSFFDEPLIEGDFSADELMINGTTYSTFGFFTSSDKRLKKDIKTIPNALAKIKAIKGVSYNFKAKEIANRDFKTAKENDYLGFIAQDLKKVVPELVTTDKDGYHSVNYDGMIPVLVEGIKEQQQVINDQQDEITDQKEIINDLQARMDKLEVLLTDQNDDTLSEDKIENRNHLSIELKQNKPNPFSKVTTIEYELPGDLTAASLIIYDMNGKSFAEYPVSGKGIVEFDSNELSNGTYIYSIIAKGKTISTRKMTIQN